VLVLQAQNEFFEQRGRPLTRCYLRELAHGHGFDFGRGKIESSPLDSAPSFMSAGSQARRHLNPIARIVRD
jgi:hypothetical protein